MKKLLIYCFIISPLLLFAQQDSVKTVKAGQGIFIGVDVFNPLLSIFSEKKGAEAMVAVPFRSKWNIVAEAGYEQNKFENSIWDVDAAGVYARAGANWFVSQDPSNPNMGYYFGGRFGFSPFQQMVDQYTIQGYDSENVYGSFEKHSASALWLEPLAGGRVPIFNSGFYVDASVRLKVLLWNNNEHDIDPLIIPGFGINNNGLNFGVNWSLGYLFPLKIKNTVE